MKHTHFREDERLQIKILKEKGYSNREIGIALNRSHTSIGRELQRNTSKAGYDVKVAKERAKSRRRFSKYQGMKVRANPELQTYIIKKLEEYWTPEEIAGRIKKVDKHLPYISAKGIYKWLYSDFGQLYCFLLPKRRFQPKRRKTNRTERVMIPNRVDIDQRPEEANNRSELGHAEADTMLSGKRHESKVALSVLTDRKARYTCVSRIDNLRPSIHNQALKKMAKKMKVKTITYDNGIENRDHQELAKELSIQTYFCKPYHSWEKGTVENTIGRIRRFIPKGSDVAGYSEKDISKIEHWLNHTPRKCLNYQTPYEIMFPKQSIFTPSGAFEG